MCKAGRAALMSAGIIMMSVILVLFGFVDTGIPRMGYLGLWVLSAGAVYYGAGAGDSKKTKTGRPENDIIISEFR